MYGLLVQQFLSGRQGGLDEVDTVAVCRTTEPFEVASLPAWTTSRLNKQLPAVGSLCVSSQYLQLSAGHLRHQPDNHHWLDSTVKHASHCHSGPFKWGHYHPLCHISTHVYLSSSFYHGQSDLCVYHGASPRTGSTGPQCQHLWHTGQVRRDCYFHIGFSFWLSLM